MISTRRTAVSGACSAAIGWALTAHACAWKKPDFKSAGDLFWCHSVGTGIVLARRSHQPLLIRIDDSRGSPFVDSAIQDPSMLRLLGNFTLVLAGSYDEVASAVPTVPPKEHSNLIVLDEHGNLIRRFAGYVRGSDLSTELVYAQRLAAQESSFMAVLRQDPKNVEALIEKATLQAFRAHPEEANAILADLPPSKSPAILAAKTLAYEAVADELRSRGSYEEAVPLYLRAINFETSRRVRFRLQVHLASCYRRMSQPSKAERVLDQIIAESPPKSDELITAVRFLRYTIPLRRG